MSAKLFQANAEGLPDRIHHSKFIHETAAAVHVDSFCDTELGVKWIWSIGGATWWREANVRAWGCAVLTPSEPWEKLNHMLEFKERLCDHFCRIKGSVCQIYWYIDRGQCDETTLSLRLTLRNVCIFFPFMGLRVSMSEHQDSGEKIHLTTEGNTHPKAWGLPCFLHVASQPIVTGNHVSRKKWLMQAGALVTSPWYIWTMMTKFSPVGSSSCFGWFRGLIHLITPYPLLQRCFLLPLPKPKVFYQWQTQVTLIFWYQLSDLSVSVTHWLNLSVALTASRIHWGVWSWFSTIIDCQALRQGEWS